MRVIIDTRNPFKNVVWFQKNVARFQNFRGNTNINRLLFADWSVSKILRASKFTKENPLKKLVGFKRMLLGLKKIEENTSINRLLFADRSVLKILRE